jgi:hypothetical protein
MNHVSSLVRAHFQKKFKNVAYDDIESYSSDEESSYKFKSDIDPSSKSEGEDSSEDEDDVPSVSASGKHQFHGMRVVETISPSLSNSYFRVEIDGKRKYIHKQTACWLLIDDKAKLSADRL